MWNLEERRLHTIIRDAHDAPVTQLHFFPGWAAPRNAHAIGLNRRKLKGRMPEGGAAVEEMVLSAHASVAGSRA